MKAVADASVLIFFAKLDRLEILSSIYPELYAGGIVLAEVMKGEEKSFQDCLRVESFVREGKLKIVHGSGKALSGEHETVLLAKKLKIGAVLMDDFSGVRFAKLHGLKAFSCPYILLKALKEGLLSFEEVNSLLDRLLSFNYFISPLLLKKIILLSQGIGKGK